MFIMFKVRQVEFMIIGYEVYQQGDDNEEQYDLDHDHVSRQA